MRVTRSVTDEQAAILCEISDSIMRYEDANDGRKPDNIYVPLEQWLQMGGGVAPKTFIVSGVQVCPRVPPPSLTLYAPR